MPMPPKFLSKARRHLPEPYFLAVLLAALGLVLFQLSQFTTAHEGEAYRKGIEDFRQQKNTFFARDTASPIRNLAGAPNSQQAFDSLSYYAIDPAMRFQAEWHPDTSNSEVALVTHQGPSLPYIRCGWVMLPLAGAGRPGRSKALFVFRQRGTPVNSQMLLPFTDSISGGETYGGGRYLDIAAPEGGKVIVDFNLAYHPYCADNARYCLVLE